MKSSAAFTNQLSRHVPFRRAAGRSWPHVALHSARVSPRGLVVLDCEPYTITSGSLSSSARPETSSGARNVLLDCVSSRREALLPKPGSPQGALTATKTDGTTGCSPFPGRCPLHVLTRGSRGNLRRRQRLEGQNPHSPRELEEPGSAPPTSALARRRCPSTSRVGLGFTSEIEI